MRTRSRFVSFRSLMLIVGVAILPACGASSKLEFFVDEPGNFRVLAAGSPRASQQTLSTPAGPLSLNVVESVDGDRIKRVLAYNDLPGPVVESNSPDALLDGGVKGISGNAQWSLESQGPINFDGHPGREVRFAVNDPKLPEKGKGRARIVLVGNRLYQAIIVGPVSKGSDEELDHYVKSFELLKKVPAIASTAPRSVDPGEAAPAPALEPMTVARAVRSPSRGPAVRPPPTAEPTVAVQDEPPAQPESAQPPAAADPGAMAGDEPPAQTRPVLKTPPARTTVTRSARRGDPPPTSPDGQILQRSSMGPSPSSKPKVAIEVKTSTGTPAEEPPPNGNERERFRMAAPDGGVLVGFGAGYVNAFNGAKVAMIQPIFQAGDKYIFGKKFGKEIRPSVMVVANPGYAIGAINTHTGLLVDAFQVVFMRFKDGQLDPADSYTTGWLGDPRGGRLGSATGDGKPVVGIHGRTNGREINALGLLIAE